MPRTVEQGRLFVHAIKLHKRSPRLHRAWTNEIEPPYRQSVSHVIRLFGRFGIVVGWWRHTGRDEETALLDAMEGLRRPDLDLEVETWQRPANSTSTP